MYPKKEYMRSIGSSGVGNCFLVHAQGWGIHHQAPVVQKVDSAIHRLNPYPLDSAIGFPNTYPLDSDLSSG